MAKVRKVKAKARRPSVMELKYSMLDSKVFIIGGAVLSKVETHGILNADHADWVFEQPHRWSVKLLAFYVKDDERMVIDDDVTISKFCDVSKLNFALTNEMITFVNAIHNDMPELEGSLISTGYLLSPSLSSDMDDNSSLAITTLTKAGCYDSLISGIVDAKHRQSRLEDGYYKKHPEHEGLRVNSL